MKIYSKRTGIILATAAMTAGLLTGCSFEKAGNLISKIPIGSGKGTVFSMKDRKCPAEEAKVYIYTFSELYGNSYGVDLKNLDFEGQTLDDYIKNAALDELTRIYCMDLLAEENGILLSEEEESKANEAARAYCDALSEEEEGEISFSESTLASCYEHYALAEKLYAQLTSTVDSEISDDEARVMKVLQIVVSSAQKAQEVSEKLEEGNEFTAVASSESEEDDTERYITRSTYPQAVTDVIYALEDGQVSQVTESDGKWYIIKVINKYDESMTEANKETILENRKEEIFLQSYSSYADSVDFKLYNKEWNNLTAEDISGSSVNFFSIYDEYFK